MVCEGRTHVLGARGPKDAPFVETCRASVYPYNFFSPPIGVIDLVRTEYRRRTQLRLPSTSR